MRPYGKLKADINPSNLKKDYFNIMCSIFLILD